ncbi:DUF4386 domain-containing protein [Mucilaginibacter sp. CAU 1740]|uniref:DUF4386 domain-containing protein n=1 Tax=Mucilaginibacter sp. CAU 1740 TaxID=3140365 RepID=UPI00325BB6BF
MSDFDTSPRTYARLAGFLYLFIIIAGIFAQFYVWDGLIASGNAAATAEQLRAHAARWQSGIVAELLMHLCDIPVMVIIYLLLRPVSKPLVLMALLFNLVQTAVLVADRLNLIAALLPLSQAAYLRSLDLHQLYAQAYLSIRLHEIGFGVGLLFFGGTCVINGYLIYRSGDLPKFLGELLIIAGICYGINTLTLLLTPGFHSVLFPFVLLPSFIAELSFCGWLLFKGGRENAGNDNCSAFQK